MKIKALYLFDVKGDRGFLIYLEYKRINVFFPGTLRWQWGRGFRDGLESLSEKFMLFA